jgi:diguanylate cyclase (GGDEF)-like protein
MSESKIFEQTEIEGVKEAMLSDPDGMALEHLKLKRENKELGYDKLTGLLNRNSVDRQTGTFIALAQRHSEDVYALFIDLDKLKKVNDGEGGHKAGDKLLMEVANDLTSTFRKSDLIARIGGDEFLVLTSIPKHGDNTEQDIEVMLNRLMADTNPDDYSLGICRVDSEGDLNEAIDVADKRMYIDKHRRDKKEDGE